MSLTSISRALPLFWCFAFTVLPDPTRASGTHITLRLPPATSFLLRRAKGTLGPEAKWGQSMSIASAANGAQWIRVPRLPALFPQAAAADEGDWAVSRQEGWNSAFQALGAIWKEEPRSSVTAIEPEFLAYDVAPPRERSTRVKAVVRRGGAATPASGKVLQLDDVPPKPGITLPWPDFPEPDFYLGQKYSQLEGAFARVQTARVQPARVGIVDVGFLPQHAAFPLHVESMWDATSGVRPISTGRPGEPVFPPDTWPNGYTHGTSTIEILAAPPIQLKSATRSYTFSGGNPDAIIVAVRAGPSVVTLPSGLNDITGLKMTDTGDFAHGFDLAVSQHVDVITTEIGGLPSGALSDAIDNAYQQGIAIFAASGDYFELFNHGDPVMGTFWNVVYPAAFDNVMAVAGVTADGSSYGVAPPSNFTGSAGLGCYGPKEKMANAVCAWTPRVPWVPAAAIVAATIPPNTDPWDLPVLSWDNMDLSGGGTSASTPQVAAAGSLLVAYRRSSMATYGGFQRAEVVYSLLRSTAYRPANDLPVFFGAGLLRAADALSVAPANWPSAASLPQHSAAIDLWYVLRLLLSPLWPHPDSAPTSLEMARDGGAVVHLLSGKSGLPLVGAVQGPEAEAVANSVAIELSQVIATSPRLAAAFWSHRGYLSPRDRKRLVDGLRKERLSQTTDALLRNLIAQLP